MPDPRGAGGSSASELPRTTRSTVARVGCASRPGCRCRARRPVRPAYELLDPEPGRGCSCCPSPSEGDVYLDFEGDPWAEDGAGREYLAGLWDRSGRFIEFWAHDFAEEGRADARAARRAHPPAGRRPGHARLPLRGLRADRPEAAHRAARHPRDRARRAAARRAVRRPLRRRAAGPADQQAVVLHQEARGLLLGPHPHRRRTRAWPTRCQSVVEYERWLLVDAATTAVLDAIRRYNRRTSAPRHDLHEWLEERRAELEQRHGALPRAAAKDGAAERDPVRRGGGRDRARRPAQGRRARAAGRRRRLAPARGAPEVVGLLPAEGPRRRGARWTTPRRSASSSSAEPTTATSSSPRCGATSSRRRTRKVAVGQAQAARRRHPGGGRRGPRDGRRRRVAGAQGRTQPARADPARSGGAQAAGGQGAAGVDRRTSRRRCSPAGPRSGSACSSAGCRPRLHGAAGGAAGRPGGPGRARPRRRGARHPGPARHRARRTRARR